MRIRGLWLPILCAALLTACDRRDQTSAITAALSGQLAAAPPASIDRRLWADMRRFYEERDYAPAWTADRKLLAAQSAVSLLQTARTHGFDAEDYDSSSLESAVASVAADRTARSPETLSGLDMQVTLALLRFGHDVAIGRQTPTRVNANWKPQREAPDLVASLEASLNDLPRWIARIQPQHPEYERLRQTLDALTMGGDAGDEGRAHAQQLALNLERWRWMPDDFGERHLLVNIPSFELRARESGRTVLAMPVVVGKADGHETPIFSSEMQTVVFSPSWNVPDSIAEGETAPMAAKDPSYLERHGIEVFRRGKGGKTAVDPRDVDWKDPSAVKDLAFRQLPGKDNALGTVKFLFPNAFDVYLHDTPADALFSRPSRAFSHGCVRVSQPEALAAYVLRGDETWNESTIKAAMDSGNERAVKLAHPIPVHLVYFTAWVDDDGGVHYEKDVYGYDAKQMKSAAVRKQT
jgi:murein L,D-transpeptidase YcbB/YkuD